jgi:hypothetical protein
MTDNDFDREKICYEQNFEQARSLNLQMNQVPVLAMTLTGGLWFGAGVTKDIPIEIRFALLLFAGLCNLAFVLAALRIRDVLESYLEQIEAFYEKSFASGRPKKPKIPWLGSYSMISIYCALMLIGAIFSFFGAFWKYWPFEFSKWFGVGVSIATLLILYWRLFRHRAHSIGEGS